MIGTSLRGMKFDFGNSSSLKQKNSHFEWRIPPMENSLVSTVTYIKCTRKSVIRECIK